MKLRNGGLFAAFSETWAFLLRRRFFFQFLFESLEYWIFSRFRDLSSTVISQYRLNNFSERRMVYASFDRESLIRDHVLAQLRFFHEKGYSIVFVTTSERFDKRALELVSPYIALAIHRKNEGYDFGSYRVGFSALSEEKDGSYSLVMMNDSCLGPNYDFTPQLTKMDQDEGAVWGVTKSLEIAPYIQSYFFHFGRKLSESGVLVGYFGRLRWLNDKWAIVRFLEIGGSKWLRSKGVPLRALVDPENDSSLRKKMDALSVTDPTLDSIAADLVRDGKLPLTKRKHGMVAS
jgi:lipopolysaccharide biosynthesis protein